MLCPPTPTVFPSSIKVATVYPVAQAKNFRVILDSSLFLPPNPTQHWIHQQAPTTPQLKNILNPNTFNSSTGTILTQAISLSLLDYYNGFSLALGSCSPTINDLCRGQGEPLKISYLLDQELSRASISSTITLPECWSWPYPLRCRHTGHLLALKYTNLLPTSRLSPLSEMFFPTSSCDQVLLIIFTVTYWP